MKFNKALDIAVRHHNGVLYAYEDADVVRQAYDTLGRAASLNLDFEFLNSQVNRSKQVFINSTNKTLVRLMPQNYGILHRDGPGRGRWHLDIDAAVPVDLAVKIFQLYHTDHDVRYGTAEYITRRLNELL